jgi:pimeloyl-ACP methyl ester carboxylesterase
VRQPDERFAKVGDLELCYEEFGPEDGEPLLLVMGLATQMLGWHEDFCAELADGGFRVIRYDNRDIGHSAKLEDAPVPGRVQMMLGLGTPVYTLSDLAGDAAGLLGALGIESAHVVGASMGGMIAQVLAIEHADRVRTLTSIMSGPGTLATRLPRLRAFGTLMQAQPKDRDAAIERTVKVFDVIGSPGFETDEEHLREVAGLSFDRSRYPQGIARQLHAITTSPARARSLREVGVPALVIHGDSDPLVRPRAGRATAKAIPGARLLMVDGMGHDLPRDVWPRIIDGIAQNAARAKGEREPAAVGA